MDNINLVTYVKTESIFPHEEICETHLAELLEKVQKDNLWFKPIVIDKTHKIILDGHHRWNVARIIGIKKVPVIEWDIFDEQITVLSFRENFLVSKSLVLKQGLSRNLLPYKTTKHVWGKDHIPLIDVLPEINISISHLQ